MADKRADAGKVIRKAWHRLGTYMKLEWRTLSRKVHLRKITIQEAQQHMQSQFDTNTEIWNLHGVTLQVPPPTSQTTMNRALVLTEP